MKEENLYLLESDGELDKLKTEIATAACKSDNDGARTVGRQYSRPSQQFAADEIAKISKYYKKNGVLPDVLQRNQLLAPHILFHPSK